MSGIDDITYPQAPAMPAEKLVTFLDQAYYARLATLNADGTIHLAVVYFKYVDGQVWMASQLANRKVRNIQRNPNVTILIDKTEAPYQGVLIYGTAELDSEDVIRKRTAIFERRQSHTDAEASAKSLCARWPSVIIRVTPQRMISFDYTNL